MQDFFTAASGLGFPVAVAGYLLFRIEGRMDKFTSVIEGKPSEGKVGLIGAIQESNRVTQELSKKVDRLGMKIDKLERKIK